MKYKQRGDAVIAFFLIVFFVTMIVVVGITNSRLSLQEVQKLEQKCLELGGIPVQKKFSSDNAVKAVVCKKDDAVYEKF